MSKLFSKEPVPVKNFEDLNSVRRDYYETQWIQITCNVCKKPQNYRLTKPIYLDFYRRKNLLCINCKKIQTFLEKYGVDSPNKLESVKQKQKENKDWESVGKHIKESLLNLSPEKKALKAEHYKATSRLRYGTDYPNQSVQMRQKLSKLFNAQTPDQKLHRATSRRRYIYNNVKFDSSWELALWIYAKDHNEEIERLPVSFTYEFANKEHLYYPDFRYNGRLLELKADCFFDNAGNLICPWDRSLDEACKAKQAVMLKNDVVVWRLKDIKFALDYVNATYGKKYLSNFKR